ncbi:MAG: restriction endonuclease subunit S [Iamia sp.]
MTTDRELKDGWRMVRFGDVVREVKVATKDPEIDGLTRVVGLEHLDSESLPLRRWNELSDLGDGTSFTRVFRAGQVLFGKRRAYQRKVAVADFDGICSSDILVFEPSVDGLHPAFLPYLVQSNGFFDHALGTSAGSLSPRTKFKELAKYEFALPPTDEQLRMVEVLFAAATLGSAYRDSERALATLCEAVLGGLSMLYEMKKARLEEVCRQPITYGIVQAGPEVAGGVPYVRVSDMTDSEVLEPNRLPRTAPEIADKYKRSACEPGDLIFALRGPIGLTRVVPDVLAGVNLTQGTARLSPDSTKVSTDYLRWALRSPSVEAQCRAVRKGSTFQELSLGALRKIEIDVPGDPAHQARIVTDLETAAEAQRAAIASATRTDLLAARLREALLAGEDV